MEVFLFCCAHIFKFRLYSGYAEFANFRKKNLEDLTKMFSVEIFSLIVSTGQGISFYVFCPSSYLFVTEPITCKL